MAHDFGFFLRMECKIATLTAKLWLGRVQEGGIGGLHRAKEIAPELPLNVVACSATGRQQSHLQCRLLAITQTEEPSWSTDICII